MPRGKLIVADCEVRDECLAGVRISGDFFLDPDSALDAIDAALNGQPVDATATHLAARIDAGLPPGTRMYGISPVAVAVAVQRALGHAT
ncbi:MAG TPA: biotin--protein ligase [Rhodanobacteraceae bacterium]